MEILGTASANIASVASQVSRALADPTLKQMFTCHVNTIGVRAWAHCPSVNDCARRYQLVPGSVYGARKCHFP